jgi:hypothetical protein
MKEITITQDQFSNAVKVANEKFRKIGEAADGVSSMTLMLTSLQNLAFAGLVATELFDENKEENTEDK